jgi:hypothetical protein
MADNLADTTETNLLDYFLKTANSTNWAQPGSLWVGLCTAAPTDSATNECTAGGYARKQIAFSTAASGASTGPTGTCTFDQATTSWGTISGYIVGGASTGSTGTSSYLFYGVVSPTVAVTTNDTVSFAANAMTLTFG